MKIKLKACPMKGGYIGNGLSMKVGDVAEVDSAVGEKLLKTWPDWFEVVGTKQVEAPAKNRAKGAPGKNK